MARPGLVGSLLLVAPSGSLRTEVTADIEAFWEAEEEALADEDLDGAVEANLETWVDGPGQPSDRVPAAVRSFVGQMQMKAFENVDGWDEEDLDDQGLEPPIGTRAAEIAVPTRILVGDLDVAAVGRTAVRLAERDPGAPRSSTGRTSPTCPRSNGPTTSAASPSTGSPRSKGRPGRIVVGLCSGNSGSGGVPVGPPVFKTGGATLRVTRWVRLPRAPANTMRGFGQGG